MDATTLRTQALESVGRERLATAALTGLAAMALLACLLPALRATRIDPLVAAPTRIEVAPTEMAATAPA